MPADSPPRRPVYRPEVFDVGTLAQAKSIILTNEQGTSSEERWEKETNYLIDDIGKHIPITPETFLLDFGCGIGRIAKELISRFGCRVAGVDFSLTMRLLAPDYVLSERFVVWSPQTLEKMIAQGFRADAAVCIWVIQHVIDPNEIIRLIHQSMKPRSLLYVLSQANRSIPTDQGWIDDRFDIRAGLCRFFTQEDLHALPETATSPAVSANSFIQVLRKMDSP